MTRAMHKPGPGRTKVPGAVRTEAERARLETADRAAERDVLRAALTGPQTMPVDAAALPSRPAPPATAIPDAAGDELRLTVGELQRLTGALEQSNRMLGQANAELEARVAERTAALAALDQRLRHSDDRLRLAQRSAGAGTWDWDIQGGRLDWSPETFEMHGLDAA